MYYRYNVVFTFRSSACRTLLKHPNQSLDFLVVNLIEEVLWIELLPETQLSRVPHYLITWKNKQFL